MNPKLPSTPPSIKGSIGAAGKEIANVGQMYSKATTGLQRVGSNISKNLAAGQASPRSSQANYSINPFKGTGNAFRSAFKKASKK